MKKRKVIDRGDVITKSLRLNEVDLQDFEDVSKGVSDFISINQDIENILQEDLCHPNKGGFMIGVDLISIRNYRFC